VRVFIDSCDCLEGWEGFSLWTRVCDRPAAGAAVVMARPPRKGLGTVQAGSRSRASSKWQRAKSKERGAGGAGGGEWEAWDRWDRWELCAPLGWVIWVFMAGAIKS
jgi:hypothetical protein